MKQSVVLTSFYYIKQEDKAIFISVLCHIYNSSLY